MGCNADSSEIPQGFGETYRLHLEDLGWWLVYSCCSHLEHRAFVKRFVSLQFLNVRHSVGLLGRAISPSQDRYLTRTQNKHRQTSMLLFGFEPTIPAFERSKTVHTLDRTATVRGLKDLAWLNIRL
jgi:hypothetical protein